MPFITTRDGTDLYVKEWGEGDPVILIHGWPLSSDSWDAQAMALADAGYRAIAYDRRGFGRSDQPFHGYDYDSFADDLADVMEEMDATDDVTLVGFSMGGGEVARYLSRHDGAGVAKVALIGSIIPYMLKIDDNPNGVPEEALQGIKDGITADRAAFFKGFFPNFVGGEPPSPVVSDAVVDWCWTMAMQAGLKPTLACVDAFGHTDFRSELAAFTMPTLIIHGTADRIVPIDTSSRAAAAGIPHATLIEYDGGPHALAASHGDRLTADLLAFLGS